MISVNEMIVAYMGLKWSAPYDTFFGSKSEFSPAVIPYMIVLVSERTHEMKAFIAIDEIEDKTIYRELDGKLKIAIWMED
jgi:hypothetical protein